MELINRIQPLILESVIDFDYAKSFSSSNIPIAIKGIKGEIVYMNESAKKLSNSSKDTIFVSYDEKLSEDIKYVNELSHIAVNKKIDIRTGNGQIEEKFFNIESISILNKFGLFSGTLFIFHDLTPLVSYLASSSGKSDKNNKVYDEMTGMLLKNQFDEIFSRETERSERYRFPLSVSVFYFENLIFFGQSFGNDKLNQVLKFIGIYFKQRLRKTDIIFRIDFNNFRCILPHTDYENAYKKFKKIKDDLAGLLKFPDNVKPVLKCGISELNLKKHYKNYGMLIEEAILSSKQDAGYTF
ncbi:MAG: diguanylate cyclase [Deltaproteobacteria bacterium]|nr:diguanylate cyclase [Deltaproteobacteria bacterium]